MFAYKSDNAEHDSDSFMASGLFTRRPYSAWE
jgi:hypothetical protein